MADDISTRMPENRRSENRTSIIEQPYSVEIVLGRSIPIYHLKVKDISGDGLCILVKEDSSILNLLEIGQVLEMKYWSKSSSEPIGYLKAQIKYISKQDKEPFKRHHLIGLFIQDKQDFISDNTESKWLKANTDLKDKNTPNGKSGRRWGYERRKLSDTGYVEERRSGSDRRSGLDRRSKVDRRSGLDRRGDRNY